MNTGKKEGGNNMDENMNNNENMSLATELLHEVKASAKRWFIAFIIMVVVEVLTIAGFLWYISLPTEEVSYYEQAGEQVDTENSDFNQTIGGDE